MQKLSVYKWIWLDLLLYIVTLGIYGVIYISAFAKGTNIACADDGKHTKGLLSYFLFSIITLGIYDVVWHYKWINRCNTYLAKHGKPKGLRFSTYLLMIFLFGWFTAGIGFIILFSEKWHLQKAVNQTYNEINNL